MYDSLNGLGCDGCNGLGEIDWQSIFNQGMQTAEDIFKPRTTAYPTYTPPFTNGRTAPIYEQYPAYPPTVNTAGLGSSSLPLVLAVGLGLFLFTGKKRRG
jgi:hypothetical protein